MYLIKPQVVEMKGKDNTIFQIIATDIEEKQRALIFFRKYEGKLNLPLVIILLYIFSH